MCTQQRFGVWAVGGDGCGGGGGGVTVVRWVGVAWIRARNKRTYEEQTNKQTNEVKNLETNESRRWSESVI